MYVKLKKVYAMLETMAPHAVAKESIFLQFF